VISVDVDIVWSLQENPKVMSQFEFKLPSGNLVAFREPRNSDRQKVIDMIKPNEKQSVDEVLAAFCVVTVNGEPPREPDPKYLMRSWSIKDSQTFVSLFLEMFTIGEDELKDIKEAAKKLLRPESEAISA
jgi:hypothetical protein